MYGAAGDGDAVLEGLRAELRLEDVARPLDTAVRQVVGSGVTGDPLISTVALVDASDLNPPMQVEPHADLLLPVGIGEAAVISWLRTLAGRPRAARPVALMVREGIDSTGLREAAEEAAVALLVVDRRARWDVMLATVHRSLDRGRRPRMMAADERGGTGPGDLSDLAETIAEGTGGIVTIEDSDSRLLAYSMSDGSADELRIRAILGREAPRDAMRLLTEWGVVRRLRETQEVVSVPEHPDLGMRPRLVTGVHSSSGQLLASIWVQEGAQGFSADAQEVVRGGAVAAAAILLRQLAAPSAEEMMVQRLFGEHGGVDAGTAADYLELADIGEAAVVGIAAMHTESSSGNDAMAAVGRLLRLHVSAFAPRSVFVVLGDRAYALLPRPRPDLRLRDWVEQLVRRFDTSAGPAHRLRAVVVSPVRALDEVAAARAEADRVLDATADRGARVTSLTQSRTTVLLREAIVLLQRHSELADPRVGRLVDYERRHRGGLIRSARAYIDSGLNAREAARSLNVHPNTLRYRLERAEQITGLDLADAEDRLLLALQLKLLPEERTTPKAGRSES